MEVGFVGCGDVARAYAADLAAFDGLELTAVTDRDRGRAEAFAAEFGGVASAGLEPMLEAAEPALVVNLTSHASHAPVTRACLEAGVAVYSEKPLALEATEANALVELAESQGVALGCAPRNHRGEQQRLAARRLADGTLGAVGVVTATANAGRVSSWHDRPASFLSVGPLFDGAVYPLSLLVEWFGPVRRVRTADAAAPYPDREGVEPDGPTHVEATLDLAAGPLLRLSASFYVPHTAREFYGIEVHGDDASLYLDDAGDLGGGRDPQVAVGRAGRAYTPVPLQQPAQETPMLAGVAALAASIERGQPRTAGARRAAHVVAVCEAIEAAASAGEPVSVPDCGFEPTGPPDLEPGTPNPGADAAVRLPPVGLGCSRYRDGTYVDRTESIEIALDAGYRLLDSAELYGNESRIGAILDAPGSPDPRHLFIVGKVWNTNHGHVRAACAGSVAELGVEALDCAMLHWPDAWAHTGPLGELATLPVEEQERRTFPTDEAGEPIPGEVPLEEAWRQLEAVQAAGLARSIGICNVDVPTLRDVLAITEVPPAIVQVERHPYAPRERLLEFCHERGIRVMAHSPLSAPGLLAEPRLAAIAERHDATPAQVVLAWNVEAGVVPIPASNDPDHIVENAAAASLRLDPADRERIAALDDPDFER